MPTKDSEALTTQSEEAMEAADEALDASIDTALDEYQTGEPSGEKEPETPSTEEAGSEEDTQSAEDRGDGRSEDGRFVSTKQEVVDGKLDPVEAEPEPGEPAKEGEQAEAEPESEGELYLFRADGTDFEIPGSTVSEKDGLHVPPEQVEAVTQLLRFGKTYQGSFRDKLTAADEQVKAAGVERDAAQAARTHLLEKLASFGENPEAMEQFLNDFARELPVLLAEAKATEAEALRKADLERLAELESEREWTRMEPQLEDRLEEVIRFYGEQSGLDTEGMRSIWVRMREKPNFERVFTRGESGWEEHLEVVEREVQFLATALGGRTVPAKREEADKNKAALKPEGKEAPPTAPTKKGPAPKATPKAPAFKTAEEADEWFEGGGYNEFFE